MLSAIKKLKGISLKFSQATLLCCWSFVYKMHWCRVSIARKKVVSSQSQKSRKARSPFLSDQVTYNTPPCSCYRMVSSVTTQGVLNLPLFCETFQSSVRLLIFTRVLDKDSFMELQQHSVEDLKLVYYINTQIYLLN